MLINNLIDMCLTITCVFHSVIAKEENRSSPKRSNKGQSSKEEWAIYDFCFATNVKVLLVPYDYNEVL